jgi:predicted phage terminase large subunit-like protein
MEGNGFAMAAEFQYHASYVASLSEAERSAWLASLTQDEAEFLDYDWRFWARPEQVAPPGDWHTWLYLAGRGSGKTRSAAEWVRENVCGETPLAGGAYKRLALIGETASDCRDVLVEGESGLLAVHPKAFRPMYEPSKRRLTWPNGAVASLFNATEPDQLRGPQFDAAWCDELAKWQYAQETWDMLQFGLRLGDKPRQVVTTTPRPIPLVRAILASPSTVATRGSTYDNAANLAAGFLDAVRLRYEGTRLGRQELNAEILDDFPGALWASEMLDAANAKVSIPDMQRVVIAVDPSGVGSSEDTGDWIGIVAVGKGVDSRCYVLGDYSCKLSPAGWGRRAIEAYHRHSADRIIGEANFGGAMVEHVIRSVDENIPYSMVRASRGKVLRAEPVAALYEQGRVSHAQPFPEMESQMSAFTNTGYMGDGSPDRVDALVHGVTELNFGDILPGAAIFELTRREAEARKANEIAN